jgi:hypothetical protein
MLPTKNWIEIALEPGPRDPATKAAVENAARELYGSFYSMTPKIVWVNHPIEIDDDLYVYADRAISVRDKLFSYYLKSAGDPALLRVLDEVIRSIGPLAWIGTPWKLFAPAAAMAKTEQMPVMIRGCFMTWCAAEAIYIMENLQVLKHENGRLHCADGPAVDFGGGHTIYAWRGMVVNEAIIMGQIDIPMIEKEDNAELRRVLIDRYGTAKYIIDSGAQKLHEDDFGTLYTKEVPGDETIMMVKVVNSTPEPDGSYKDYWLRVDPRAYGGLTTARAAVASTWRNPDGSLLFARPEDYVLEVET